MVRTLNLCSLLFLTSLPDSSNTHERADFWRAYTISLLFQNKQVQSRLNSVDIPSSELVKLLRKVLVHQRAIPESPLRELILTVMRLAAQLRCQRGVYEVDDTIRPGDRYNDERMVDFENPDLVETEADRTSVYAIVSNGVLWRSFTGEGAVQERIVKARVLVVIDKGDGE